MLGKFPTKMVQNGSEKKKNIVSLKHATYKIEERGITIITNMKRGKNNLFDFLECMAGLPEMLAGLPDFGFR